MRWDEEAKDRLRYYGQKKRAVEHLEEEIYRLEQEATALRGGILDGTRSRSAKNDRVLNNMVMRQELEWTLKDTRRWLRLTESAIDSLDDDLREVLNSCYIQQVNDRWQDVCASLQLERSNYYRLKKEALRKFTISLYGAMES